MPAYVTIAAGTRISVRTIDGIDSTKNRVGDRFEPRRSGPGIGSQQIELENAAIQEKTA